MPAVNKVILVGNVGRDPEVRDTPSGSKVASFSLATTERFNDQQGNKQEKTEWHNLVAWNKQAETIQQYVKTGTPLYIEGSLQTRSWDDQATGQKKYKTEIVVRTFQFLGQGNQTGQNQSGQGSQPTGGQQGYQAPSQGYQGAQGYQQPQQQQQDQFGGAPAPEDDLPF